MTDLAAIEPSRRVAVRDLFGIDADMQVLAFDEREDHVPDIDPAYRFNADVTLAILAGFMRDRRVMVQGLHGTGTATQNRPGRNSSLSCAWRSRRTCASCASSSAGSVRVLAV